MGILDAALKTVSNIKTDDAKKAASNVANNVQQNANNQNINNTPVDVNQIFQEAYNNLPELQKNLQPSIPNIQEILQNIELPENETNKSVTLSNDNFDFRNQENTNIEPRSEMQEQAMQLAPTFQKDNILDAINNAQALYDATQYDGSAEKSRQMINAIYDANNTLFNSNIYAPASFNQIKQMYDFYNQNPDYLPNQPIHNISKSVQKYFEDKEKDFKDQVYGSPNAWMKDMETFKPNVDDLMQGIERTGKDVINDKLRQASDIANIQNAGHVIPSAREYTEMINYLDPNGYFDTPPLLNWNYMLGPK